VVLIGWKTLSAQLGVISYFDEPRIPFDQISTLGRTLFRFFSIGELAFSFSSARLSPPSS
jgi:hypothetical protein